jgi:hypothetical protein
LIVAVAVAVNDHVNDHVHDYVYVYVTNEDGVWEWARVSLVWP